jgi:Domain of Unknown Function (DUF1080)
MLCHVLRRSLPLLALVAVLALLGYAPAADDDKDFTPLFNGKNFTGWKFVIGGKEAEAGTTFAVRDGIIAVSGSPNGYMQTAKSYKNYVLRYDFRFPDKAGNSGLLVHIQGLPAKGTWPTCIEVQGQYNGVCSIFPIGGATGPRPKPDDEARKKALKPHTEWNSVEVVVKGGAITASLNGTKVCESEPYELKEGPIGWQSEGAPIDFRNIRIKEMK